MRARPSTGDWSTTSSPTKRFDLPSFPHARFLCDRVWLANASRPLLLDPAGRSGNRGIRCRQQALVPTIRQPGEKGDEQLDAFVAELGAA
jgi:hypothetical protein